MSGYWRNRGSVTNADRISDQIGSGARAPRRINSNAVSSLEAMFDIGTDA